MTKQILWTAFWKTVLVVVAIGDVLAVFDMDFLGPVGIFKRVCAIISLIGMVFLIVSYMVMDYFEIPDKEY